MKMKIEFTTDNAAFNTNKNFEIARILKDIAYKIEEGYREGVIVDIDGNKIGEFKI